MNPCADILDVPPCWDKVKDPLTRGIATLYFRVKLVSERLLELGQTSVGNDREM